MKQCPKCGELVGDSANKCFNCFFDFVNGMKQLQEEREQQRQAIAKRYEEKQKVVYSLNDVYEYDVVSITDSATGRIDLNLLREVLRVHGSQGWRLVNSFTNEVGSNRTSFGAYGFSSGTNATVDETLLIFERCVKRYAENN